MEIQQDIDSFISSYLEGSANEAELRSLLNWIKQDENNLHYFNQVCNLWENATNIANRENETEIALKKLNNRIYSLSTEKTENPDSIIYEDSDKFYFWRYAAIAIIITGLSAFLYFSVFNKQKAITPAYVTAIAPKSEKSRLILSDGTEVWLNSGTTLKYKTDYGTEDRRIYLDGEAYFVVAKNPSKPFLVYAANIVVKAIGTSFNVRCYADDKTIETTLIEGKVQVSENINEPTANVVMLLPNERAIFNRDEKKLIVAKLEPDNETDERKGVKEIYIKPKSIESLISWKNQELIFENEPFEELSKRLERWYNVEIVVLDKSVNLNNSYTGKFVNNESLEQVLKIISRTTPIKYTSRDGKVFIEAKNNKNP